MPESYTPTPEHFVNLEIANRPLLKQPVQAPITQSFGNDATGRHTFYELFDNKHPGVDFNLPEGTPIRTSFAGLVVRQQDHPGMGNTIGVRNGNIVALYAHLSTMNTALGEYITDEHLIGLSGNTGQATFEPHLHFELRDLTQPTLPSMVFEPKFDQPIERWQADFTYTVNNTNTPKTLHSLAMLFFGHPDHIDTLLIANPHLSSAAETVIPQQTVVLIPNPQLPTINPPANP